MEYVLVTGATGFIGAHVLDVLLSRGLRVRGATRSRKKAEAMIEARPQYASKLDFVQISDFEVATGGEIFEEAVKDVDGIIHVASPLTYDTKDNEKELVLPAINGVRCILEAAAAAPSIRRVVVTSSFAAVVDTDRPPPPPAFIYTGADWNPLSYADAVDPAADAVTAYRGAKKFAERAAWDFVRARRPRFDLVALCPPMTFGPVRHPVDAGAASSSLNESNAVLWRVAASIARRGGGAGGRRDPLPVARVPFWIDVRDLAQAHAAALVRPEAGGRRYVPASPERFSYGLAARIISDEFAWARGEVPEGEDAVAATHGIDGETAARELGFQYRPFRDSVVDLVRQVRAMVEEAGGEGAVRSESSSAS